MSRRSTSAISAGGAIGPWEHPVLKDADGRKLKMKNGIPDMKAPGVILPEGVKSVILLADLDSETFSTAAQLRTAGNRFRAMGIEVEIAWPDGGADWNDIPIKEGAEKVGRSASILEHPYRTIEAFDDFLKRTDWIFTPPVKSRFGAISPRPAR